MRTILLLSLLAITVFACSKTTESPKETITGRWAWKTTTSNAGLTIVPTANAPIAAISFSVDGHFTNESNCLMGIPASGTYEAKYTDKGNAIFLKDNYTPAKGFMLKLSGNHLELVETNPDEIIYYKFERVIP